jgi:NAD(P)-dependent dehydrogenase (short-subunit alcohol dehydrogenase family)
LRLDGKVAIVTGAGSKPGGVGTGKAIAVQLAREGAQILLVDRHEDRVAETCTWIEKEGGTAAAAVLDLANPDAYQQVAAEAVAHYGRIDILVSNAAAYTDGAFLEITREQLDASIAVNLVAPFMLSQAVIPAMVEAGGGSIVYITSILAMRGGGPAPYASTKAGLMGLTTSLANTFGKQGIRVNCVAPGNVETPVRNSLMDHAGIDRSTFDSSRMTSLAVKGDAWDVARAVAFLAGPDSAYITGLLLPVDGGSTTRLA